MSSKVIYIYVNVWNYFDNTDEEVFRGHPKPNHVYRAVVDDSGIKIPINNEKDAKVNGVLIPSFKGKNDKWEYDLKEISEKDIALLNISANDLKKINKWESIDNSDLKYLWGGAVSKGKEEISEESLEAIADEIVSNVEDDFIVGVVFRTLMEYMYSKDSRFLLEIVQFLAKEIDYNLTKKDNK